MDNWVWVGGSLSQKMNAILQYQLCFSHYLFQMSKQTQFNKYAPGNPQYQKYLNSVPQQQKHIAELDEFRNNKALQYNQLLLQSKNQKAYPPVIHSNVLIRNGIGLILALDDILTIKLRIKHQEPSTLTEIIIENGQEKRLAIIKQQQCEFQACSPSQIPSLISQPQGSQSSKIKSFQRQYYQSQKITNTISFAALAEWLKAKLFRKNQQTYLCVLPLNFTQQQQKKTCGFFNRVGLSSVLISSRQLLIFNPAADILNGMGKIKKEWIEVFERIFGEIVSTSMNIRLEELNSQQLYHIKARISQNPKDNIQFPLCLKDQNNNMEESVKLCVSKEFQSQLQEFVQSCLLKYDFENIYQLRALGYQQDINISNFGMNVTLRQANHLLRTNGLFGLKLVWKKWLKERISHIIDHFQIYQQELRTELLSFVRLHELNLLKLELHLKTSNVISADQLIYEAIYPDIVAMLHHILMKLNAQALSQLKQTYLRAKAGGAMNEHQLEVQFCKLIEEQLKVEKITQKDKLFIFRAQQLLKSGNLKENLSYQISNLFLRSQYNGLVQPFRALDVLCNPNSSSEKQLQHQTVTQYSYLNNIQNEKTMNNGCLGCSRFFYQNFDVSDPIYSKIPLKTFEGIDRLNQNNTQLVDIMCGMLNSGGGIILFGCKIQYSKIKIVGNPISQKQKQQHQHKLVSIMNFFHPKLDSKEISASFVPVYKHPQQDIESKQMAAYQGNQGIIKKHQAYFQRRPMNGYYVCRIIVRPNDLTKTYMYSKRQQANPRFYSNTFQEGKPVELPLRSLRKFMKTKIKDNHLPEYFSDFQKNLLKKESIIDHKCGSPEIGIQISSQVWSNRLAVQRQQSQACQQLTIVFHKPEDRQQIKNLLTNSLRGLRFVILQNLFANQKFPSEKGALYLSHSQKFQTYYEKLKQYQKSQKLLLVNVVQSLKIIGHPSQFPIQHVVQNLKPLFEKNFVLQNLQLFQYKKISPKSSNSPVLYFITQTKKAAAFLFFYMKDTLKRNSQIKFKQQYDIEYCRIEYQKVEISLSKNNQQSQPSHPKVDHFAIEWNQFINRVNGRAHRTHRRKSKI